MRSRDQRTELNKQLEQGFLNDKLLTTEQVASSWSVCPKTVRRFAKRGVLPEVKIGRSIRYRLSDVQRIFTTGL